MLKKIKLLFISFLLVSAHLIYANGSDKENSLSFIVNPSLSSVEWSARKVAGAHNGQINILDGQLLMQGDAIKGGEFTVDMNSITCADISDERSNTRLVNHLKSDDFFGSSIHPVSSLVIISATRKSGNEYEITGNLTIKGITNEIVFPAKIQVAQNKVTANAEITVDRTKYDIKYRSGSFFDSLGDRLIYDDFNLKVELVASQDVL
jgi:polyisoprenoid-binding protein YceI